MDYRFDHNWFTQNIPNLKFLFRDYQGHPKLKILEIGSFEGMSTTWFLDCVDECQITCIDTWAGGNDHDPNNDEINFENAKQNYEYNISHHPGRVTVMQMSSYDALISLNTQKELFDFVYVDGSHTAIDVNTDLVLSWRLLKIGGIIYCDDYFWGFNQKDFSQFPKLDSVYNSPKLGIDSFVNVYRNKIRPVSGLQNLAMVFIKEEE